MKYFYKLLAPAFLLASAASPAQAQTTPPCYKTATSIVVDSGCTLNVKSGGTLQIDSGATAANSGTAKINGNTLTATTGTATITIPNTTDTLVNLTGSQALTGKTYNGLTVTTSTGTLTVPNSVTLTGPAASGTAIAYGASVACGGTCTLGAANLNGYTRLDTASGSVATLPAATGSGATYRLYVSVATGSNADKVLTNPTSDTIIGTAIGENAGTAKVFVGNASTYHSLQMPFAGSQPSGGFVGDTVVCTDVASTIWKCDINYQAGTTPTTPYSASTS